MDRPIRLGILGPGRIVRRAMHDFYKAEGLVVTAVASRSMERAREAAALLGAQHVFDSYEQLAECADVDLVYVATPHNFHMEQSILMMEHGKHVLCEKPMALNADQAQRMAACARKNNVFLMEAMWTRFFPASAQLRELIADGAIGRVTHFYAEFACLFPYDPTSRAYDPALAGGALLDLGIYPAAACTMILGYRPSEVQGAYCAAPTGVDARAAIQLTFPSGATAQLMCAFDAVGQSREVIYGTAGRIEVDNFWHPTGFTLTRADGSTQQFSFPAEDEGHYHEFVHAAECIRRGIMDSPIMSLEETIALAKMFTDLRRRWGVIYPEER